MNELLIVPSALGGALALGALALNPRIGIPLIFLIRPVIDTTYATPIFAEQNLSRIFSASVVVVVLLHMVAARGHAHFRHMPMNAWWLVFSAYAVAFSLHIILASGELLVGAEVALRYLNGIVGAFMLQAYFFRAPDLRRLLLFIVAAGVFPTLVGLYQVGTGFQWKEQVANLGLDRYIGLYHDAVTVRFYMLQTLLAIIAYVLLPNANRLVARGLVLLVAPAALLVMYNAFSKSAVTIVAAWALIWIVFKRDLRAAILLSVVAVGVAAMFHQQIATQIGLLFEREVLAVTGEGDYRRSFAGRWFEWGRMIETWSETSNFEQTFGVGVKATWAHNDFLQMLFHGGIVGLVLYVSILVAVGIRLATMLLRRASPLNLVAAMAFVLWLVDSIGLVPSAYPGHHWLVWGFAGLAMRVHQINLHTKGVYPPRRRQPSASAVQPVPAARHPAR